MTTKTVAAKTTERRRFVFPSGVEPAPDILDDDMPDAMYQHPFYLDIVTILKTYFEGGGRTLVDGDFPLYYRDANGVQTYVKPDCGVSFGVNPRRIFERNGYFLDEVGKTLDFVLEIGSTTTANRDTGFKRELYEWLKIPEYFGFDGTGGKYYQVPLFGWRLRDGKYVPVETTLDENGATWAYSEQLGLYLCAEPELLRVWDPRREVFLNNLSAERRARERLESELRVERLVSQNNREALRAEREDWQTEREGYAERIRELEDRLRGDGG